jgi:hypothetical protein
VEAVNGIEEEQGADAFVEVVAAGPVPGSAEAVQSLEFGQQLVE